MSGVIGPVLGDAVGSGRDLAEALMAELKLSDVKELETVDYHLLAKAYNKVKPALEAAGKYVGCKPHPNAFYMGEPGVRGFREETKHIPLLVGSVFGEFTSFTPSPYDRSGMSEKEQEAAIRQTLGEEGAAELIPLFREAYPERQPIDLLRLDFIFRAPWTSPLTAATLPGTAATSPISSTTSTWWNTPTARWPTKGSPSACRLSLSAV